MSAKQQSIKFAMSRRFRAVIVVVCLLLGVVFVLVDRLVLKPSLSSGRRDTGQVTIKGDYAKYHGRVFDVVNVVDGDTIDVNSPDGQYGRTRIRFWGVDTPETKSEKYGVMYFGPEAAAFTEEKVLGKRVCLYLDEDRTRGKYGRVLAYVQLSDGRFLNEMLVSEGYGYADSRFSHSLFYKYQQLGASARREKRGLWRKVTRQQLPEWLKRKRGYLLGE